MFTLSEYISFGQEFSPRLQTNENYVCKMTNSEFSNFFETLYLQEVNKANRAKFVMSQSGLVALRRAEFEHTGHTGIE
jgi:hypothetical protein